MGFEKVFDAQNGTVFKFEEKGAVLEGHYMGSFDFEGDYGPTKRHVFSTDQGAVIVIGQRHLIQTLPTIKVGTMVRITYDSDLPPKKKGQQPMKLFGFEQDKKNCIDVAEAEAAATEFGSTEPDELDETDPDADEPAPLDEAPPARAKPPQRAAQAPSAERQRAVQDLLAGKRKAG